MVDSVLNFGVVGFGHWGNNLARNVHHHQATRLAAIADLSPINLAKAKQVYPDVALWNDAIALVRSRTIDAVVISTPAGTHFELASLALEAGKHVLLTKPITLRSQEALVLTEVARSKNRVLLVDHTYVYSVAFEKLKSIINAGTLGRVMYYDSQRSGLGIFKTDVDVIHDLAIHDIAIVYHLFAERPVFVSAVSRANIRNHLPSQAYINLFYESGLSVHIAAHWLSPLKQRQIVIAGSEQMICWDDTLGDSALTLFDSGATISKSPVVEGRSQLEYREGTPISIALEPKEALALELEDFVKSILNNVMPISGGEDACSIMKVADAANESACVKGAPVPINWIR